MLYYSGLMFFSVYIGNIRKLRNEKIYLYLVGLLLAIISGFRHYTVGVDSAQYYYSYRMIAELPWGELLNTRYEMGYVLMCKLLSCICANQQFLFIATSLFINATVMWFIRKYSPYYWLSVYLYISLGFFYNTMNILRQSLAMCIILLGIPQLIKRKRVLFVLIVLLASQFHTTAIIALLLPLAIEVKDQKKIFYGMLLIGVIGFVFGNKIFSFLSSINEGYKSYTSNNLAFTNYFATSINAAIALVFLIFYLYAKGFRLNRNNRLSSYTSNSGLEEIFLFVLMAYITFELIAIKANVFERVASYFSIFSIIILPFTLMLIKNDQYKRTFLFLIITFTYLENMVILIYRPYWTNVVPYHFYK